LFGADNLQIIHSHGDLSAVGDCLIAPGVDRKAAMTFPLGGAIHTV
jgi:hypothetical protein